MLRSIADIARSEGFDLAQQSTQKACLEVFALGGPSDKDDGVNSAYYRADSKVKCNTLAFCVSTQQIQAVTAMPRLAIVAIS